MFIFFLLKLIQIYRLLGVGTITYMTRKLTDTIFLKINKGVFWCKFTIFLLELAYLSYHNNMRVQIEKNSAPGDHKSNLKLWRSIGVSRNTDLLLRTKTTFQNHDSWSSCGSLFSIAPLCISNWIWKESLLKYCTSYSVVDSKFN